MDFGLKVKYIIVLGLFQHTDYRLTQPPIPHGYVTSFFFPARLVLRFYAYTVCLLDDNGIWQVPLRKKTSRVTGPEMQ